MYKKGIAENVEPFGLFYKDYWIPIDKGFRFDGATIPRFLWSFIGICPFGWVSYASIVHDWIYNTHGTVRAIDTYGTETTINITRKECDELFVEHLLKLNLIIQKYSRLYKEVLRYAGYKFWPERY